VANTYAKLPRFVLAAVEDGRISQGACTLWAVLRLYAWRDQQPGTFSPHPVTVADVHLIRRMGGDLAPAQLHRWLDELQAAGLLRVDRARGRRQFLLTQPNAPPDVG
jgi:hypothetical protein